MSYSPGSSSTATTIQPVIGELLRTCVHPPVLNLRIEHIVRRGASNNDGKALNGRTGRFTKLFLTDGEYLIQALLHHKLSTLPEIEELNTGDIVEVRDFVVRKARRTNAQDHVVYLGIENCYVIKAEEESQGERGQNGVVTGYDTWRNKRKALTIEERETFVIHDEAGGFFVDDQDEQPQRKRTRTTNGATRPHPDDDSTISRDHEPVERSLIEDEPTSTKAKALPTIYLDKQTSEAVNETGFQTPAKSNPVTSQRSDSDDEEAFETIRINPSTVKKRRQALHELSQNVVLSPIHLLHRTPATLGSKQPDSVQMHGRPNIIDFRETENTLHLDSEEHIGRGLHHCNSEGFETSGVNNPSDLALPSHRVHSPAQTNSRPTTPNHVGTPSHAHGPLKSLASLYSPSLPSKSFVFTTIVIPTYVAPYLTSRPNSPFPPKRHLKVIDPSLAAKLGLNDSSMRGKGITVSVYRNAATFKPTVGRVALMRGVVMQRLTGASQNSTRNVSMEVILNVYPERLKAQKKNHTTQTGQGQISVSIHDISDENNATDSKRDATNDAAVSRASHKRSENEELLNRATDDRPSETSTVQDDLLDDSQWFIDDHDLLRRLGYNITAMQSWWDHLLAVK